MDKVTMISNKPVMAKSKYYAVICMEGPRKTTRNLSQKRWHSTDYPNQATHKYKSRVLPVQQPVQCYLYPICSVTSSWRVCIRNSHEALEYTVVFKNY
jgi:hypothetical protein